MIEAALKRSTSISFRVRESIRTRAASGLQITRWFVERQDKELFDKAMKAYKGDFKAAVKDAGFNYKEAALKEWSEAAIRAELMRRQDNGLDVSNALVVFKENPDLYIAATTRHRTWKLTLNVYGIDIYKPKPSIPSRFDSNGLEKPINVIQRELEEAKKKRTY